MSKLPKENQFLDLSDYGRPIAVKIAKSLKNTSLTPVDLTYCFLLAGLLAIVGILNHSYWVAAFFLILKSILDAADGELARMKRTPSYTGRYLDSIFDFILNLGILLAIGQITHHSIFMVLFAFFGVQLQGTLYNYYYVILRNKYKGDTTSRIFEDKAPKAFENEKQQNVTVLFTIYRACYGLFDKIIYKIDTQAINSSYLPNWFMMCVSIFGLGFQLLLIGLFLVMGFKEYIIPFFIGYTLLIFAFIGLRKFINR
jgi:hypothetical protein